MCKSKMVGIMVLIAFATVIVLVGDAVAGEKGKGTAREVFYGTTFHTINVPDVEGHTIALGEAKMIHFSEKFGPSVGICTQMLDLIKGTGTCQGYNQYTYPDGSTISVKWKGELKGGGRGKLGAASSEGTWTYIKGTGKYQGIQGGGTWKSYNLAPGQWYSDSEGEYTLP